MKNIVKASSAPRQTSKIDLFARTLNILEHIYIKRYVYIHTYTYIHICIYTQNATPDI